MCVCAYECLYVVCVSCECHTSHVCVTCVCVTCVRHMCVIWPAPRAGRQMLEIPLSDVRDDSGPGTRSISKPLRPGPSSAQELTSLEVLPNFVGKEMEVIEGLYNKLRSYSTLNKELARAQEKTTQNAATLKAEQARLKVCKAQIKALRQKADKSNRHSNSAEPVEVEMETNQAVLLVLQQHSLSWQGIRCDSKEQEVEKRFEAGEQEVTRLKAALKKWKKENTLLQKESDCFRREIFLKDKSIIELQSLLAKTTAENEHVRLGDCKLRRAESAIENVQSDEQTARQTLEDQLVSEKRARVMSEKQLQEQVEELTCSLSAEREARIKAEKRAAETCSETSFVKEASETRLRQSSAELNRLQQALTSRVRDCEDLGLRLRNLQTAERQYELDKIAQINQIMSLTDEIELAKTTTRRLERHVLDLKRAHRVDLANIRLILAAEAQRLF